MLPSVGEIVFCTRDREGNSSMTWSYSVPRVISALSSTPVPFNTEVEAEGGNKVCDALTIFILFFSIFCSNT